LPIQSKIFIENFDQFSNGITTQQLAFLYYPASAIYKLKPKKQPKNNGKRIEKEEASNGTINDTLG
jgi:hypothetical protein